MFRLLMAALAAGVIFTASAAQAANYNRMTAGELAAVFRAGGYSVGAVNAQGIMEVGQSFVWITDCNSEGRCSEINFFNNFRDVHPTLQAVNEWNNTKKLPEASVNTDGTLHMEIWLSAIGMTDANLIDSFSWFERYSAVLDFWKPYMTGV